VFRFFFCSVICTYNFIKKIVYSDLLLITRRWKIDICSFFVVDIMATSWHGSRGDENWELPEKIVHSSETARPGYGTELAHEYQDSDEVLTEKAKLFIELLRESKKSVIYSGAGLSTSAGIGDYASKENTSTGVVPAYSLNRGIMSPMVAKPTLSHYVISELFSLGLLNCWIQQNHDGLPQKAGFPQHAMNEIHGSWYDPSNPVIPMSGSLRGDYFENLLEWEKKCDLCVAVGTSLAGMNADRVVSTVAEKGVKGKAIGSVIINLQRTSYDGSSALRVFSTLDRFFTKISSFLVDIEIKPMVRLQIDQEHHVLEENVFLVPYGSSGKLILQKSSPEKKKSVISRVRKKIISSLGSISKEDTEVATESDSLADRLMELDLREGAKVRITGGVYEGDEGVVTGKNAEGHYKIRFMHTINPKQNLKAPMERVLGTWWVEAACNGTTPMIPVVSITENDDDDE